ncbi:MAG: F0F1 ATP synthase subunit gamma [Moorella humiferrea]|uniref:ATP synthase gamma chain n=1 Tax=Neomoorella humiferrea TaxID=676965 RepID=A0A2T0AKW5_9FIRM|nr:ATP synthase F1 subunit gamma [Moorella humiferrea]MBE3571796.1 F0F1 ATP synthase subunit gamma [Moorella humiferrea]PRR69252.1 ATP synthase gamma chain [Moorella humiferrea]
MPSMRDLKRRIRSIRNTQHITRAMKMVAAAKLRKAQAQVTAARPYTEKLEEVVGRLMGSVDLMSQPLAAPREVKKVGYVLITGDRGLAGGYNANLIRLAEERLQTETRPAALVAVGRKGRDYFRRRQVEIVRSFTDIGDEPDITQARELARQLVDLYLAGTLDEINLIYSRFYSALRQVPRVDRLLPIAADDARGGGVEDYIYEPSPAAVLQSLLPRYCEIKVYRALLEAKASEHGARMTAMDNATENAAEMIDKLTLSFNRARQAAITREIVEVVAGADALK